MRLRHSLTTGLILTGIGAYKTYCDYKSASEDCKTHSLIRNVSIIGACALGVFGTDKFLSQNFNSQKIQSWATKMSKPVMESKFIEKLRSHFNPKKFLPKLKLEFVADVISDCTKDVLMTAAGMFSGIGIGQFIDKVCYKNKPIEESKIPEHKRRILNSETVHRIMNDNTREALSDMIKIFETAGLIQNPVEKPFIIIDSLDASKGKDVKKTILQTSEGIVLETLIPTFIMSLTSAVLKHRPLRIRFPALIASMAVSMIVAKQAGKLFNKEFENIKKVATPKKPESSVHVA